MSNTAIFRFYEELGDFLPAEQVKKSFVYTFYGNPAIKDAIEAIGVPHTEVDLVLVNGTSVEFSYQLQQNDRVAVYPVFESLDISPIVKLRPAPLREPKFILDVHLGKLARLLRMLGFDTLYRNDYTDDQIIQIALKEHRTILTRDRGILKHSAVTHGSYLHTTLAESQAKEILKRYHLYSQARPFTRCINCNGLLQPVDKESIKEQLPSRTSLYFETFFQCNSCKNIYWPGTHLENMKTRVNNLLNKTR